jgi:hypothetical protein
MSPKHNFIADTDWRDAMKIYVGKFLLSNQVVLFKMLRCLGEEELASQVRESINFWLWDDGLGHYQDFFGSEHFDCLGHSLGILWDVFPRARIKRIVKKFGLVATPFGFKNIHPPYPKSKCGQRPGVYQNSTVWPFVDSYAILALIKTKNLRWAKEEFLKMVRLEGFNEWYDPIIGVGRGSSGQLWSASTFCEVASLLGFW